MKGHTVRTPEKVAEAIRLREAGLTYRAIGERLGVSLKTACDWIMDPDGTKRDQRKARYVGTCIDCGARTYSGGPIPSKRCRACAPLAHKIWTREAILTAIRAWANEHGGIPPVATDWNPALAIRVGHPERAEKFYADDAWPHVNTVRCEFGSWNAAIRAAGYSPRRSGTCGRDGDDPELCREIAERYAAGESTLTLAREYGCTASAIGHRIWRAGGRMRTASEAQRARHARRLVAA